MNKKKYDLRRDDETWSSTWGQVLNLKVFIYFAIFGIIGFFIFANNYPFKIYCVLIFGLMIGIYLYFGVGFRSVVITYIQGYFYLTIYFFFTDFLFLNYILFGLGFYLLSALLYKLNKVSRNYVDLVSHWFAGFSFCFFFAEFFSYNLFIYNSLALTWGIVFEIIQFIAFRYFDTPDLRYSVKNSFFDIRNNAIGQLFATIIVLLSIYPNQIYSIIGALLILSIVVIYFSIQSVFSKIAKTKHKNLLRL